MAYGARRQAVNVHRLVFMWWKGEIPQGYLIRHSCDNPACCNPDHLLLGTHADNMRDKAVRGRVRNRKLTDEQVREIRHSTECLGALSERYGVGKPVLCQIRKGTARRHVA